MLRYRISWFHKDGLQAMFYHKTTDSANDLASWLMKAQEAFRIMDESGTYHVFAHEFARNCIFTVQDVTYDS